ncbi:MAG: NADP-specific glutamate dehydrogenase [Planctomycetota bacterium]
MPQTMTAPSSSTVSKAVDEFMEGILERNPNQPEFQQAVREVIESLMPVVLENEVYRDARILERITEPDRAVSFRVTWQDDQNRVQVNRGYRVQFSNAIGPYKGGLRFHPTVNLSVLKFLGFEQIFKNSLTGLPMGGGKGGADFNPKGKSDSEVMRFCQAFMTELSRHIGADTDVPAGDIGVGGREVAYMFGQYKRIKNHFTGVLTGKGLDFGGSKMRTQATGYGTVYFAENMMKHAGDSLSGKTASVSGSGNVALYCIEKLNHLGAKVVTASDSSGSIHDPNGIDLEKLEWLRDLKENRRGRIHEYAEHFNVKFMKGERPWSVACDAAFPCATQNELDENDARTLVSNGVIAVAEGANMPTTLEGAHHFIENGVRFAPGKAANAGGVAVSGLEMSQNSLRIGWSHDEVDERLKGIMQGIHERCVEHGTVSSGVNYVQGANVAGFIKVADAMLAQGVV